MVVYLTQWDFGRSWDGRAAPDCDGEMTVAGREDCGWGYDCGDRLH